MGLINKSYSLRIYNFNSCPIGSTGGKDKHMLYIIRRRFDLGYEKMLITRANRYTEGREGKCVTHIDTVGPDGDYADLYDWCDDNGIDAQKLYNFMPATWVYI